MKTSTQASILFWMSGLIFGTNTAFIVADPDNWIQYAISSIAGLGVALMAIGVTKSEDKK